MDFFLISLLIYFTEAYFIYNKYTNFKYTV